MHRKNLKKHIPHPPHARKRRTPLPWQAPKSIEDDPAALERVRAIIESPGYRQADQDIDFLNQDETRGVRLEIDYMKPQLLLEKHGVKHTIVAFGSTRIVEPCAAKRRLKKLKAKAAQHPDDRHIASELRVAERILEKSRYYDIAREFGRLVGKYGRGPEDPRITLCTGGGPGMMEAANRGAFDAGAKSIGLNITLPHEQYPNPYISPELCFRFHYFATRKLHFLLRAKALVAFPGGYGTFDELFEALTLIQTRKIDPIPVVLVGESYWSRAVNVNFLAEEGVIDHEDKELFWFAESAEEIWESILHWHEVNGSPLSKITGTRD